MHPELRAVCDRVWFDSANVLYLGAGVQPEQEDARAAPGGWTVRQVLGHLGATLAGHAEGLARLLAGEPLVLPGVDVDARNAAWADDHAALALPVVIETIRRAREDFLDAAARFDDELFQSSSDGRDVAVVLLGWSRHFARHAFDLLDALPQFRRDPIAVNWALFLDVPGEASLRERQRRLVRELDAVAGTPGGSG